MSKAAIYVRLSDEDRHKVNVGDESESIVNQKALLSNYCNERNWDIYDIYCDEDYSGTDFNRPDFRRMLADCEQGKIDIVLCKSQSRFSRDMAVVETYVHDKFPEWGVRFVSIIDNADSFDSTNKKTRQINGLVNEWYCEELSYNVRRTLEHKRREGKFTGSFAPYGYKIDPADKNHLIIDEIAAPVVQMIFGMYAHGDGYRKITKRLNELGHPSPSAYKEQNNPNYRNVSAQSAGTSYGLWTVSTISKMLRNEVYTGKLAQGKSHNVSYKNRKRVAVNPANWIVIENTHEAIIDTETWKKTTRRLSSRERTSRTKSELSILGGKVKCAVCHKPMKRNIYHNKKGDKEYYNLTCGTYKSGAGSCANTHCISGLVLEKYVLAEINAVLERYYDSSLLELCEQNDTNCGDIFATLKSNLSELFSQLKRKENMLTKTYEDKLSEIISNEQYQLFSRKFTSEISNLKTRISDIENQISEHERKANDEKSRSEILSKYTHFDVLTRPIVDEFIEMIYVGEKVEDEAREVEIYWKI